MWITRTSINQPVFATMVMLALVVTGVFSYRLLPVEHMPEINAPRVFATGFSAGGMMALLLWALLSSVAILFGAAVAVQLEAVRAGASAPRDETKAVPGTEPSTSTFARTA